MTDDLKLRLKWSIKFVRQQKLIAALKAENSLLRAKLNDRAQFDIAADQELPSILRRQA